MANFKNNILPLLEFQHS